MVTIKDVAAKAGVNPSTVSRVLKDSKSISQKTKDTVRKAMAELGYVPNVAAQMLASGLTYNVGFIFPPLITPDRLNEPFFMQILSTITSEAKLNDFTVSIATGMTVDNSAYSTLIHPYMTTFDINVANLGRTSFRRLVELIKSPETAITEKIIVPFTLRERESVRQLHVEDK